MTYFERLRFRTDFPETVRQAFCYFRTQSALALGIALNAIAVAAFFWLSTWYKINFPQYVRSNYSVESYLNSGLSFTAIKTAFIYLIQFHARGAILGPATSAASCSPLEGD